MSPDLSDLFAEQESNVVEWGGELVYGLYEFKEVPERFTVEFLAAKKSPVQGLSLDIDGAVLVVNGIEADSVVLWRDTAPALVTVAVRPKGRARVCLRLWNVWRVGADVVQAWLGNSAMRIEQLDGDQVVLHCSDGEGPATFDDLVVVIRETEP